MQDKEFDFSISSLILILFFFQTCHPLAALICSPLPLKAPHLPSFHALRCTIFFFFHSDFPRPSPVPNSFTISPSPASSCWAEAAWKQLINSPVLLPLLLLENLLWDGINQHQVWHLPEDTQRTRAIRWSEPRWPSLSTPHGPGYQDSDGLSLRRSEPCRWPHVCAIRGQHIHLGRSHPFATSSFSPLMAAMPWLIEE